MTLCLMYVLMKKIWKKWVVVILTLALCLGCIPVYAGEEELQGQEQTNEVNIQEEILEKLYEEDPQDENVVSESDPVANEDEQKDNEVQDTDIQNSEVNNGEIQGNESQDNESRLDSDSSSETESDMQITSLSE